MPSPEEQISSPQTSVPRTESQPLNNQLADSAPSNPFWIWLSLFLAIGWLSSGLVWWWQNRRQLSRQQSEHKLARDAFKGQHQKLKNACLGNDVTAVKSCLPGWANQLTDTNQFDYLQQLESAFGDDFRQQINLLNESQYSKQATSWDGQVLWSVCEQLARNRDKGEQSDQAGLAPLNPA